MSVQAPKKKKHFKVGFIILAVLFTLGGAIHYAIAYKVKNVLQVLVKQETNDTYVFDASISISIWHKTVRVKHAELMTKDTTQEKTYHYIKIPEMYLKIDSWRDVIFNGKVTVDSLAIMMPHYSLHEKLPIEEVKKKPANVDLASILKNLQKVLVFLEIKSFTLSNGSFSYHSTVTPIVLRSTNINFSIRNMSKNNTKLLHSDDIHISMENQHWTFPDGIHTVSFKKLEFSGKNQFFELDSCTLHAASTPTKGEMNLFTEKFFFNSVELSATYEKNALYIDTLLCINPTLTLELKQSEQVKDTAHIIKQAFPHLFKHTIFRYVNIKDGQVIVKNNPNAETSELTKKSNLIIYNLSLKDQRDPYLQTDSILIGLRNIRFLTPDSMFQILAEDLTIVNNDLVLKNASFGPTKRNHTGKGLTFTAPEFRLNNINYYDLINKKLKADSAELCYPHIIINSKKDPTASAQDSALSIDKFYHTLHSFRELIGLEKLRIVHGNLAVTSIGKTVVTLKMRDINALLLPTHFVNSDSLVDIKHSMPKFDVTHITVQSGKASINIHKFSFNGIVRKNSAEYLDLTIGDNTFVHADNLYWEIFDWDLFQKYKRIQITDLRAQNISVQLNHSATLKDSTHKKLKELPDIRIFNLDVNNLTLSSIKGKDTMYAEGQDIHMDTIVTVENHFTWKKADGIFKNISFVNKHMHVNVRSIELKNSSETIIKDAYINMHHVSSQMTVSVPMITIQSPIYSTDFSNINVVSMVLDQPKIVMHSKHIKTVLQNKHPFHIPLNLDATNFIVHHASISYVAERAADTITLYSDISLHAKNLHVKNTNTEMLRYEAISIDAGNLEMDKNEFLLDIPESRLILSNGSLNKDLNNHIVLKSAIALDWKNAAIKKIIKKDSSTLIAEHVSGFFKDDHFAFYSDKKPTLRSILSHLTITESLVSYKNHTLTMGIGTLSWLPSLNTLYLKSFYLQPLLSRDEYFKHASYQSDYMTMKGEELRISGITFSDDVSDSLIHVRKIFLSGIDLTTARDKNIPARHVKPKEMPTKLIQSIPIPLKIDTIRITKSNVTVHQITAHTRHEGIMPLKNINATITNVTNRSGARDSLYLSAQAELLSVNIQNFSYSESYADSLSYFRAYCHVIPGALKDLNKITVPMMSMAINTGSSNHLYANWAGNKYAAIGQMNFPYNDLSLRILDKQDTAHKSIGLKLENTIANDIIINKNNKNNSVIFFERNDQKQVFNYWIKSSLSGVMSSVGVKSNKKYLSHYKKNKDQQHLPSNK